MTLISTIAGKIIGRLPVSFKTYFTILIAFFLDGVLDRAFDDIADLLDDVISVLQIDHAAALHIRSADDLFCFVIDDDADDDRAVRR